MPATMGGAASQTCVRLRSASEPISQNTISTEANGFCDRLRVSQTSAVAMPDTARPARISVTGPPCAPASATTASIATAAPISPPSGRARAKACEKPRWIASTAPSAAPPEMPIRLGSASGLRR